jgi:stachyose synthetase
MVCFLQLMAPPNSNNYPIDPQEKITGKYFDLCNGRFSVNGVTLLFEAPSNVFFSPFCSIWRSSDAPPLIQDVLARSYKGGFLGLHKEKPSDRLTNSLGKFSGRDFLSIFMFKAFWSTMWVGNSGSDLQMETQWVLLNVPEIRSYVIIIPTIEGGFRSALHLGCDGHVMICAESGSTQVRSSSFDAIAYVHCSENPYDLMKEAYRALRVHLNTFRLLEEKTVPSLVDKFGWGTWDAFYLTVEPADVWHGMNEFAESGVSPRFLILDDGWQSIKLDGENPKEDAKNFVLGGIQMTARLHRLDECEKFRKYASGSLLDPNAPRHDPLQTKMIISKAIQIEHRLKKDLEKAIQAGVDDISEIESKIQKMKQELNELLGSKEIRLPSHSSNSENHGMKVFTRDLRTKFKGLNDIYVWHALCGAWGGVRPASTHLNSKIIPCKVSPGLVGTMNNLAVVKIVEGGIGLVHPDQAEDFYDSMHSYLAQVGITGVKVDVIHVGFLFSILLFTKCGNSCRVPVQV